MKRSATLLSLVLFAGLAHADAVVYLAPNGRDANPGTEDAPFQTLVAALAALGGEGGTVYVADGTYTFTAADTTDESDKGAYCTLSAPVWVVGKSGDASKVTFTRENVKTYYGRIFTIDNAGAGLRHVTVKGGLFNTTLRGGNVYITSNGGTVEDCILSGGNCGGTSATERFGGGNIFLDGGRCSRTLIVDGKLGNIRPYGSGVYADGNAIVENCLITGGSDPSHTGSFSGGAVRLDGSAKLVNCTVVGNRSSRMSGVYIGSTNARAINCVIYGNTVEHEEDSNNTTTDVYPNTCYNVAVDNAKTACFVNCATDADTATYGTLNSTMVALSASGFADADNADWHLSDGSVCCDAGADYAAAGGVSTTDLDGNARLLGDTVDIGCYEKVPSFFVSAMASAFEGQIPTTADITFTAAPHNASGTVAYTWDFGDNASETTAETSVTHTYAEAGSYTVSVTAVSGDDSFTYTFSAPIAIYEFHCEFTAASTVVALGEPIVFEAVDVHSPESVQYTWDFGDGTPALVTAEESVSHTYAAVGAYTVSATAATEHSGTIQYTFPEVFGVIPHDLYVAASGSDTYPYDTWEKAAKNPQSAIDAAVNGCVVHIQSGTYSQRNGIAGPTIEKGITVVGEGATPEDVVLLGWRTNNQGNRNLFVDHEDALVCNLVLDGGFCGAAPGGGNLLLVNGTVSNCVLRSGRTRNSGADCGGARVQGGLLTHCVVTNSFQGNRGNGIVLSQSGGRVSNCLLGYNKLEWDSTRNAFSLCYVSAGTIENCTIVGGRILRNDPDNPLQMGKNSDKPVNIGANATAINLVLADIKYTAYDKSKIEEYEAIPLNTWTGTAASFVNCATDDAAPINDICRIGTTATFFADYAAGDLTPKLGGGLVNHGATVANAPAADLAGSPRIAGSAIDIGAYECQFDPTTVLILQ